MIVYDIGDELDRTWEDIFYADEVVMLSHRNKIYYLRELTEEDDYSVYFIDLEHHYHSDNSDGILTRFDDVM